MPDSTRRAFNTGPFSCATCDKDCLGYPWSEDIGPDCKECAHTKWKALAKGAGEKLAIIREQQILDIITGVDNDL